MQLSSRLAKNPWFLIGLKTLVILCAGLYVYLPALSGSWLWDDATEVTKNSLLHDFSGLGKIWFSTAELDYFPLKSTVQWICWHLVGDNAAFYHGLNIVTHLISALLIWRLLNRLGFKSSWLGGLLFAIHPLAIESVAWISELKNTLSLIPLLMAMLAFIAYESNPVTYRPYYIYSLILFLIAMLCKSSVVMFPAVILLYLWYIRGKVTRSEIKLSIPFFFISLVLGCVTVWFQINRAIAGLELPQQKVGNVLPRIVEVVLFYTSKSILPVGLMPMYPHLPNLDSWLSNYLPGLILLAFICFAGIKIINSFRGIIFGLGSFLMNLFPVLGFIPMSFFKISEVSDHFAYLSLVSLICLCSAGIDYVNTLIKEKFRLMILSIVILVGSILALMISAHEHAKLFKNSETYWSYALAHNPNAPGAAYNLAWYYTYLPHSLEKAEKYYKRALEIKPDFFEAEENYASILARIPSRLEDSILAYKRAIILRPNNADIHNSLGATLINVPGRINEAIEQINEAIRLNPESANAHDNLAIALASIPTRMEESLHEFQISLRLEPNNSTTRVNYANILARLPGRMGDALDQYELALKLKPVLAETHFNYANKLIHLPGRADDALRHYEAAIKLKPEFAEAHNNLALNIQAFEGRKEEALKHYLEAIRIKSDYAEAHFNYAELLASMPDRLKEALSHYQIAIHLSPEHNELNYKIALILAYQGNYKEALTAVTLFLNNAPKDNQGRSLYNQLILLSK